MAPTLENTNEIDYFTGELVGDLSLLRVDFSDSISATIKWSNEQTTVGSLVSRDSEACIEKYTLQDEAVDADGIVLISGCEGQVKEMQLRSSKYGNIVSKIQPDGSAAQIVIEEPELDLDISIDNHDFENEFPDMGLSMATQLPSDLVLEVVLYITPSFRDKATQLGYLDEKILARQVFSHAAVTFIDKSWGDTKIHLKAIYVPLVVETNLVDIWKHIVPKRYQKIGRLHSLLLGEGSIGFKNNVRDKTLGIAFTSTLCGKKSIPI